MGINIAVIWMFRGGGLVMVPVGAVGPFSPSVRGRGGRCLWAVCKVESSERTRLVFRGLS